MRLLRRFLAPLIAVVATLFLAHSATAQALLPDFLDGLAASDLVEGADTFGAIREDVPVAPLLRQNETIGWVFITSDFVSTTGYSGKPIHTMVAVDAAVR